MGKWGKFLSISQLTNSLLLSGKSDCPIHTGLQFTQFTFMKMFFSMSTETYYSTYRFYRLHQTGVR